MDSAIAARVGAQFEAMLLERVLQPLEQSFGEFGEIATSACARSIAEHDRNGFSALLSTALERQHE